MRTVEEIISEMGFDCVGTGAAAELSVLEDVRAMCAADKCHMYDKTWACPPACGTIEDYERQMHEFKTFAVVQTVAQLEDEFDGEAMMEASALQQERMRELAEKLDREGLSEQTMVLTAGACRLCTECTYPDAPCRFPQKRLTSMEAAGLLVSNTCLLAGIPYNHGRNTIAYSGCVLYN